MTGKWVLITLIVCVAMFGLGSLKKHKWKLRLGLIGVAMGIILHDLINAIAASVVFGIIFLIVGSLVDFLLAKFKKEEIKEIEIDKEITNEEKKEAIEKIGELKEFDLEKIKELTKLKSIKN